MLNESTQFHWACLCVIGFSLFLHPIRGDEDIRRPEKRGVTVADAIQMTRWADRGYFFGGSPGPVALFSPDGKQFIIVVRKGNIEHNTNEYSLLLFRTGDVFYTPRPRVLVTMSSSSNRDAILNVKWLDDNETVVFLGENPGQVPEVYGFNVRTSRIERLTNHPSPIVAYEISTDGQEIVYEADPLARNVLDTEETKRNGVVVTTQFPPDLLSGDCGAVEKMNAFYKKELFIEKRGWPASRVFTSDFVANLLPLYLSRTGRYAVLSVYVADIPPSWSDYQDKLLHPYIIESRKRGTASNVLRYMLLDTKTLQLKPLLNSPQTWYNAGFAWAKDESSVVLSGVYLPLEDPNPSEREAREKHTFVAEVTLSDKKVVKITDDELKVAKWDQSTGKLLLEPEHSREDLLREAYQKVGSTWTRVPITEEGSRIKYPLDVTLTEDVNTPPKILVSEERNHRGALLFDLNPQFGRLQFGKVAAVRWKATDGHEVVGGLYLPPDYIPGKRYPLVIQTHGFNKDRFWIDGPWSSAFAAQPLASNGFVVLQVGGSSDPTEDRSYSNTPQEAPRQMAAYEGAIDYLDGRGLIDRSRAGIIGFSRTVFYVEYTLTHSKYRFAAATLADGFDGGYVNSVLWEMQTDYGLVNGGPPFGSSLVRWRENSPGFNLDRVRAATRLEYYGPSGPLGGWEWFSGISFLKKPVDFIWLPFGTHLLVKPWERMISQQGNVDWFSFWLKGEEDPDPTKAEQYARWRELRKQQEVNMKKLATEPKGK